ncbi:MAG: hypothetical protein H6649_00165 [Caldilineae bacterium]|nr:hypothetical protein [Anaerolineae bacterium]MCB0253611.1 hypothetical protein [Anaerolineae bacterium]MCB9152455.1 hypothetical protein [Caldilineae bacterium]
MHTHTQPSRPRVLVRGLIALALLLSLLLPVAATAAPTASILAGPCAPGATYDPACDTDHDGDVDIFDIQLSAGHWNQSGAWTSDNDHNHLGQTWTGNNNPVVITGVFDGAPYTPGQPIGAPLVLANTLPTQPNSYGYGLRILDGAIGTVVDHAGTGMWVESADSRGYYVARAGQPSFVGSSPDAAGFAVDGTGGNGLFVGRADKDGVRLNSVGDDGVEVLFAGDNGLFVQHAVDNGVEVGSAGYNALYVESATSAGLRVVSATSGIDVTGDVLAGVFVGNIQVIGGSCSGCLLVTFGVNTGDSALQPGELVSLAGLRESSVDSVPVLMEVSSETGSSTVVGVVQGWAELVTEEDPRPSEIGKRLVPREGAAEPGQYVTIAYSGLTQVKATGPIGQGSKLAVGSDGTARALRTVTVDGVELAENAAVIGTALESLDAEQGSGLIWVLLNVQ